jgi:hypothetical protein
MDHRREVAPALATCSRASARLVRICNIEFDTDDTSYQAELQPRRYLQALHLRHGPMERANLVAALREILNAQLLDRAVLLRGRYVEG